jgi:hypothetical protein
MIRTPLVLHVAVGLALGVTAACAPAASLPPEVPESQRHVAELHRAKCGNCHVRVEPGARTHLELEAAFVRHRKRVHLTEDEWTQMIDYLAQPPQG